MECSFARCSVNSQVIVSALRRADRTKHKQQRAKSNRPRQNRRLGGKQYHVNIVTFKVKAPLPCSFQKRGVIDRGVIGKLFGQRKAKGTQTCDKAVECRCGALDEEARTKGA